ncbi:type II toxin-antitoxin system RelE/ParE family toxin [Candidatus Woesearchaeota archaeon]|nr:type II toxin-antitoxin system RelE/ParE family toxin [Candidatus Woesearchaeota archaeon]
MYEYKRSDKLKRILKKLYKKDKKLYQAILKKINEILHSDNPDHYKNLSYDMKEFKRVHIGSFILVFKIEEKKKAIKFEDFGHHDDVYRK